MAVGMQIEGTDGWALRRETDLDVAVSGGATRGWAGTRDPSRGRKASITSS